MSADERIDIVDTDGEVISVTTRGEAHEQGLLHKTVISEVIDSQGRWLLVRQSATQQDAGRYVSPVGGHVTAGETEEDALKREVYEELGIQGDFRYERIGAVILNRHVLGRQENHLFVVYKIFSDAKPKLNEESESCEYFTEGQLRQLLKESPKQFGAPFHFVVKELFPHLL